MAKSKRAAAATTSRRGKASTTSFEVEDQDAPKGPQAGLEAGLVFVTFAALVVAIVMAQMELASSFGKGLLG